MIESIHLNLDPISMSYPIDPIAIAHSPYKEKFAIPRQPGLVKSARTRIELIAPYNAEQALTGLEQTSHIWLLFLFHQVGNRKESLQVRPPRLGGNQRLGVFATRSTHRPNGIGQSAVQLDKIEGTSLWVTGADLLDQTPIIDIKPYIPYSDSISEASNRLADSPPDRLQINWTEEALLAAQKHEKRLQDKVVNIIEECLAQNPSPAYHRPSTERIYGVQFWDLDIKWCLVTEGSIQIMSVSEI